MSFHDIYLKNRSFFRCWSVFQYMDRRSTRNWFLYFCIPFRIHILLETISNYFVFEVLGQIKKILQLPIFQILSKLRQIHDLFLNWSKCSVYCINIGMHKKKRRQRKKNKYFKRRLREKVTFCYCLKWKRIT